MLFSSLPFHPNPNPNPNSNLRDQIMKIGFIGLGNVGGKLAGSLLRNKFHLTVRDLDKKAAAPLLTKGAHWGDSPKTMAETADIIITCLPSPAASAKVMEDADGILAGFAQAKSNANKKIWLEMSTTDASEVQRLGEKVTALGALPLDTPVSGGCHRAATGNIAIFAGGERAAFEKALPALCAMGRRILHTGELGSASILKVVTNYLASANLVSLCEALATSKAAGMDMNVAYEAIRISSGNSFVHETESQVILNGSRDINFTMDLVCKDIGLFNEVAQRSKVALKLGPLLEEIFQQGMQNYGAREHSPNIIKNWEQSCGLDIRAPGFPPQMVDNEPEAHGQEVQIKTHKT